MPIVVASALAGVTNGLEEVIAAAAYGDATDAFRRIRERHVAFAAELAVDPTVLGADLDELERLAVGASLVGEVSSRTAARILAKGEILLTRIGAAWLAAQGVDIAWLDARELLVSDGAGGEQRRYLSAHVPAKTDPDLQVKLAAIPAGLVQGFVAREPGGETVVLGRGGSDTSAAILAARLGAERCEIWTDVPGMFTADPHKLPAARLLRALDYAEAQEIATTGAKVLHPRCLPPVREANIPLLLRYTPEPSVEGTRIAADAPGTGPQVKALSHRKGLVLVSMETVGMWQEVGFLAAAFAAFRTHGLSVDMVSTSETEVTVTLDPAANLLDSDVLERLVADLRPLCQARLVTGCASISLVGRGIRTILHRLAPVFELFEEQRVHLVSQAASDLNLTFVVDESHADRLLAKLHQLLFAHRGADDVLGPTWQELFAPAPRRPSRAPAAWWSAQRDELIAVAAGGTPVYAYDGATIRQRASQLTSLPGVDRVLYAVKANPHSAILRALHAESLGFETVSPGEIARVREAVGPVEVLFTPNFAPASELRDAVRDPGVRVTLDNLHPLEEWPELFAGTEILLRLDPGRGHGHHAHVRTAGARSKFGIAPDQIAQCAKVAARAGVRVVGLHAHVGSGVLDANAWQETALFLAEAATEHFPEARILDLGGGIGVPDRPSRAPFDLAALGAILERVSAAHPASELWLEPGRFLVAEAGVLLARVTQLKRKGDLLYVGVDAGMHTLIRPALYGAWHAVVNLTRLGEPANVLATVVGPICETGDVLARDRRLADPKEGDVLLFANAGAYGAAMASDYNLRGRPREELLAGH